MNPAARARLFDAAAAFEHPVTVWLTGAVVGVLAVTPLVIFVLTRAGTIDQKLRAELWLRYRSWAILVPLLLGPILLGAAWAMLGVGVLGLLCYREFARATGLFRERLVSAAAALGIAATTFAALDNYYRLFVALTPLTVGLIAVAALLADRPKGYIQRVGLGTFAFALFGCCLGHLALLCNDADYRPVLILTLLCVELNDIFAFCVGKTLGRKKFVPNVSPNKTVAGAVGALTLTTILFASVGTFAFPAAAAHPLALTALGAAVGLLGQCGDLMLSAIKRDLGTKDMAATLPGHGGLLDRFDSLLLVGPAVFHYWNYFADVGADGATRVFTGG